MVRLYHLTDKRRKTLLDSIVCIVMIYTCASFHFISNNINGVINAMLTLQLSDAYEEVEEQRQVVGTWKRKVQKLTGEMNDLKLLLEEQSSRNNLLEKKQR